MTRPGTGIIQDSGSASSGLVTHWQALPGQAHFDSDRQADSKAAAQQAVFLSQAWFKSGFKMSGRLRQRRSRLRARARVVMVTVTGRALSLFEYAAQMIYHAEHSVHH